MPAGGLCQLGSQYVLCMQGRLRGGDWLAGWTSTGWTSLGGWGVSLPANRKSIQMTSNRLDYDSITKKIKTKKQSKEISLARQGGELF
jgi:hypothetical protein